MDLNTIASIIILVTLLLGCITIPIVFSLKERKKDKQLEFDPDKDDTTYETYKFYVPNKSYTIITFEGKRKLRINNARKTTKPRNIKKYLVDITDYYECSRIVISEYFKNTTIKFSDNKVLAQEQKVGFETKKKKLEQDLLTFIYAFWNSVKSGDHRFRLQHDRYCSSIMVTHLHLELFKNYLEAVGIEYTVGQVYEVINRGDYIEVEGIPKF